MSERSDRDPVADALPPESGYRRRRDRALGRLIDLGLDARQQATGLGREIDRAAEEMPSRRVLALAVYGEPAPLTAALDRLGETRHELTVAFGAMGEVAPALREQTRLSEMSEGKFANLNRLAATANPLAADWVLLLDDDVELPARFLDRLICVAEALRLDLAQPALTRASHGAWDVNRRRPAMARETNFVEIGPVVLLSRRAWRELTPFPESGMGWGLCLVWAALAKRQGWRLGIVDAVAVRNESRPPAAGYDHAAAKAAALELLREREHISRDEAERVLATHPGLP